MFNFSQLAFDVTRDLKKSGVTIHRTHAHEVLAALLGYGTYAALLEEERITTDNSTLEDADHIVLQPEYALGRAQAMGMSGKIAQAAIHLASTALIASSGGTHPEVRMHSSFEVFRDDCLDPETQETVFNSDQLNSAFAETNAYCDEVYPDSFEPSEPLLEARKDWSIKVSGSIGGEQDPDRPYCGHEGTFEATFLYDKVGRVGLRYVDVEIYAGIDHDSWRGDE